MTCNPLRIIQNLFLRSALLFQLVKRDVLLRYRGEMFGVLWIFLSPLLMLAIFAFVFGYIYQARWPQTEGGVPFWILLYGVLSAFNIFTKPLSRSPTEDSNSTSNAKK